jgi:hypothetical protein
MVLPVTLAKSAFNASSASNINLSFGGSGNNTLKLNLNDLLDTSTSTNILKVLGDSGDTVTIHIGGIFNVCIKRYACCDLCCVCDY